MTDQERKVMEMVLDALEWHVSRTRPIEKTTEAMDALRQALAQPEQPQTDIYRAARHAREVLDYVDRFLNMNEKIRYEFVKDAIADLDKALAQPEQEPLSLRLDIGGGFATAVARWGSRVEYVSQELPHRKWIGMTNLDIPAIRDGDHAFYAGAQYADAWLKEKNT